MHGGRIPDGGPTSLTEVQVPRTLALLNRVTRVAHTGITWRETDESRMRAQLPSLLCWQSIRVVGLLSTVLGVQS
jgi:hypothetical protein